MSEVAAEEKQPLLFRCSSWGRLQIGNTGITEKQLEEIEDLTSKQFSAPKGLTEKQAQKLKDLIFKRDTLQLGAGAKTYVHEYWLQREYGYKVEFDSKQTLKGKLCEQDGFALTQEILGGEFRHRNLERLQNAYISGMADCPLQKEDWTEDQKISWDLKTYFEADGGSIYEWQGRGYMGLWNKKHYRIVYNLINTPPEILKKEKTRKWYALGLNHDGASDEAHEEYVEFCQQLDRNHIYDQIPKAKRVKVFEFSHDEEMLQTGYKRVELARIYYDTLDLLMFQQKLVPQQQKLEQKEVEEIVPPVEKPVVKEDSNDKRDSLL